MKNTLFIGNKDTAISEIWISRDICLFTTKTFSEWNKFWAKFLLGWIIKFRDL